MAKFLKNIFYIISFLAAGAAIVGVYFQLSTPKSVIEIKTISSDKLTDLPSVDGLKAIYTFKTDTVKSLFKMHYVISNVGDATIIGEGNSKNLIHDNLKFNFGENFRIIDFKINKKNFPFKISANSKEFVVKFLQWKTDEKFDIFLYVETFNKSSLPTLKTDEREIINGEIKYTTIYKEIVKKESLFEYLPKFIQEILKWFAIICFGIVVIICPIAFFMEFVKIIKYKKWEKEDKWMYSEWVYKIIEEHKLDSYKEPTNLPFYLWNDYPYPKPDVPKNDFKNMTIGLIFLMILFAIPIALLVKI